MRIVLLPRLVLLRKVLGQMEKLELLHWDLTINETRSNSNTTQTDAQSYLRTNPEGFWLSRSKTITELFQDVAVIPALDKLFLKMPWWEAAILKPLASQAEIHLLAEGAGIYGWKPQVDKLNMSDVFGQLVSLDITGQEYNGNSYVHTILQRSQETLQQLALRSQNGLDYPEKYTDLVFPKLKTLVWEVYNPNPFDRQLLRLSNRHAVSISTFDKSKTFLMGFLKRHTGVRSVRIIFINSNNHNIDAGEESPAITSCAEPFIEALGPLPELEFLQFVGLPVSWEFALSIMKQHPRLQGLWLPISEGSFENSFRRHRTQNEHSQYFLPELRQLMASGPHLKLLSLGVKKRWFQELTYAVCTMLKNPGMLAMAAVVGNYDLKRRLLFVSDKACGGRDIEFWRSRDLTFAPVQDFSQIQLGVELRSWEKRTGSSVWLDEPEWDRSEDFMNGLKDGKISSSTVFLS